MNVLAVILGLELARQVDLRAGDVAVHIDAAGHDDQAIGVERAIGPHRRISRWIDDFAVVDPDVAASHASQNCNRLAAHGSCLARS